MSGPAFRATGPSAETEPYWTEYRIGFADQTALARLASGPLSPLLDELRQQGQVHVAFFVRKEPGLRLRVHWATAPVADPVLGLLHVQALALPLAFHPPVSVIPYRERALFGGEAALELVETFFDSDSRLVLSLAAGNECTDDPLAVSAELIGDLFRAAALDQWEIWSMWQDLAVLRGGPSPAPICPTRLKYTGSEMRRAQAAAQACAAGLRMLAEAGGMSAPLRSVLPVIAAYHLNRMGFGSDIQAALATGAALELSPFSGYAAPQPLLAPIAFERMALGPASVFDLPDLDACIRRRNAQDWRDLAPLAEISLLRQAVEGPMRAALQCRSSRPLEEAPAVLGRPPGALRKHDRRTIDTVLSLVWRHCANPVPFADLAATRLFDPSHPERPAELRRASAAATGDPFATDRFDPRPAAPLPDGLDAALAAAATAFSRADAPCPDPAQIALAALLDRIGKGHPLRLCEADTRLAELAEGLRLPQSTRDPLVLAHALGLAVSPWPDLPEGSVEALPNLHPPASAGQPSADGPRRVAMRLQSAADGVRLVYFGADRMCWLARYVPRNHAMERPLRRAAGDWLARWPGTVDATAGFSNHRLDDHAPLTLHGARLSPQNHWLQRRANGLYDLTDCDGRSVHAVHFGVSAPASLDAIARLALQAGARLPSWGEWVLGALNRRIVRRLAQGEAAPLAFSGVTLGGHLLLPGCACVLPAGTPAIWQATKGDPQPLWDLLCAMGGPDLVGPVTVQRLPGPETRVLDLRLPSGLRTLARMAARSGVIWLMLDPIRREADGTPAREHYIELAAAPEDCHCLRSRTWTSSPLLTSTD